MKVAVKCPSCSAGYSVEDSMLGKKAKCPKCSNVITLAASGPASAASPTGSVAMPAASAAPPPRPSQPPSSIGPPPMQAPGAPPAMPQSAPMYAAQLAQPAGGFPGASYGGMPPQPAAPAAAYGGANVPMAMPQPGGGLSTLSPQDQFNAINGLVQTGRYVEAMQGLKMVEPQMGNQPGFNYLAGLTFIGMGNFPHALDNLNRAIQGGIADHSIYAAKGKAELSLGQHAAAIASMDKALTLAGTDVPDYMAYLAKAYEGAGMKMDAGVTWNALQQINPTHWALQEREQGRQMQMARKQDRDVQQAMLQMQREQRASDTMCWICIILRCLLECM